MTKRSLSHIRDCALLAASVAMVLFVVLMPFARFGATSQFPGQPVVGSIAAASAGVDVWPHDGRVADLSDADAEHDRPLLPGEADDHR